MTHAPRLTETRLVLAVRDLQLSAAFYIDQLGFQRDFGDGSDGWAFLSRDQFKVMLGECPDATPAAELGDHSWVVYVTAHGVDALHEELRARGVTILSAPESQPWGERDFTIRTPDGHRIKFGEPVE